MLTPLLSHLPHEPRVSQCPFLHVVKWVPVAAILLAGNNRTTHRPRSRNDTKKGVEVFSFGANHLRAEAVEDDVGDDAQERRTEVASRHCVEMELDYDSLEQLNSPRL